MTREQAILELRTIQRLAEPFGACDPEIEHRKADAILCELLTAIGYDDVVREYEQINKWYA